jgi:hypothetical protein
LSFAPGSPSLVRPSAQCLSEIDRP